MDFFSSCRLGTDGFYGKLFKQIFFCMWLFGILNLCCCGQRGILWDAHVIFMNSFIGVTERKPDSPSLR